MNRKEVEKWVESSYESGAKENSECINCLSNYTSDIVANSIEPYRTIWSAAERGCFNYTPVYNKISGYRIGRPEIDRVFAGFAISIKGVFCSKECLIDFILDNQGRILELITQ